MTLQGWRKRQVNAFRRMGLGGAGMRIWVGISGVAEFSSEVANHAMAQVGGVAVRTPPSEAALAGG